MDAGANAKAKMKATHEFTIIRADGTKEKAFQRELTAEETQKLWEIIQQQTMGDAQGGTQAEAQKENNDGRARQPGAERGEEGPGNA